MAALHEEAAPPHSSPTHQPSLLRHASLPPQLHLPGWPLPPADRGLAPCGGHAAALAPRFGGDQGAAQREADRQLGLLQQLKAYVASAGHPAASSCSSPAGALLASAASSPLPDALTLTPAPLARLAQLPPPTPYFAPAAAPLAPLAPQPPQLPLDLFPCDSLLTADTGVPAGLGLCGAPGHGSGLSAAEGDDPLSALLGVGQHCELDGLELGEMDLLTGDCAPTK